MLSLVWVVLAIVATVRGARWKPWLAVGAMFLINMGVGFLLGASGYRAYQVEEFLIILGFVTELLLLGVIVYFIFRPTPSQY